VSQGAAAAGHLVTVTVIKPRRGWAAIGLRELWQWRDLLYLLALRDVKLRYTQTLFGVGWALIQPLSLMVIFTLALGRVGGLHPEGVPYALFALAGLVPWMLFSQSLGAAAASLTENTELLTKVYFPRPLLPLAAALSHLIDFAVATLLLVVASFLFGQPPTAAWILLLVPSALALTASFGFGLILSAVNVRYRDVRYAIPFLLQLWFFATPIAYGSETLPPDVRPFFWLNPMTGSVDLFRAIVLGTPMADARALIAACVVTAVVVMGGSVYFRRAERTFADVI
jgi:lipopolysaccharide transport system permease protein